MCKYCKEEDTITRFSDGSEMRIKKAEKELEVTTADGNTSYTVDINYCPMCGSLLKVTDIKPIDNGAGAIATAEIMNPILQENTIINDIQKVINESILNSVKRDASGKLNLSENFMKGGSM